MATMTSSPAAASKSAARVTAATPTSGKIRSSVPSTRVLRAINPFVSAILRSPMHRLLNKQVLLLTVTGRKSGKAYTFPVGYIREADTITILSGRHVWWKNLRRAAPVTALLEGHRHTGRAEVIEDREALLGEVDRLVARYGLKGAGQRLGIGLGTTPPPSREDIAQAMQGHAVIRLFLDGVPDRASA